MDSKNCIENINNKPSRKVNILMVDDHPENLLALEAVLTSPNYHLVSATSGKEALRCMLKQDFAVILLDVQMPGLNGFETAKLIKSREKTRNIPIIFVTAISQEVEHVKQGYSVGAIDYIFKPFHPETLRQKIEQFVQLHQNHEETIVENEKKQKAEMNEVHNRLDQVKINLQRSEALSKVIGETILDTIITFDEEGYILSVNPAVENMFGYYPNELIGKNTMMLFQIEDESIKSKLSSIKVSMGKVIEVDAIRKDSCSFPADIQIGKTIVENQLIFVCTIRDVTERKQMEKLKEQEFNYMEHIVEKRTLELIKANKELEKEIKERKKIADDLYLSQDRFQKIFESSPCLMAIYSLKFRSILDVNTNWVMFTGYSLDEIMKTKGLDYVVDSEKNQIDLELTFRNEKICYKTKNGDVRYGLMSTEMIEIQDEPCTLIVVTDITERLHLEKEMYRLDRLNLIGEMAAGIAHEIRNPMTTVHGFLQLTKNSSGLSKEILDLMLEELNRANTIITEFLNLAKNKVSLKKKQSINKIINALSPLIQAEALRSSKLTIFELNKCSHIFIDQKEIRQMILNIALNGLDAMDSGGQLTIKTYEKRGEVILEISDQGMGISSEVLEKIGTPFFTTKETGTGLGLAICYSVAERHNADINIHTGDSGTTFSIHFKVNE
ncbi:PAS domain S-box protein [Metabacillus schmidteae]|uniref:PAS domain S-box protein n=1 Tax=Metabacillus schmidteae TaxID=2730405 RepID=UPI00158CA6CB|nr:PAS domain S-box protein [Metabacillus schmidteae]